MEEELRNRIDSLKIAAEEPYVDSSNRERARTRLEYLEELYDAMYGY